MRKKIIGLIALVAFVLTMALNVSFGAKNNSLSDISLANIEALAKKENKDEQCCTGVCWIYPDLMIEVFMRSCDFNHWDNYCQYGHAFWPC